jgi:FkbM family methyltransferase
MSKINISGDEESINVTTLNTFLKEKGIEKIDLIKIDFEGEEKNVLLGSIESIKRDKPPLVSSIYHNPVIFLK